MFVVCGFRSTKQQEKFLPNLGEKVDREGERGELHQLFVVVVVVFFSDLFGGLLKDFVNLLLFVA